MTTHSHGELVEYVAEKLLFAVFAVYALAAALAEYMCGSDWEAAGWVIIAAAIMYVGVRGPCPPRSRRPTMKASEHAARCGNCRYYQEFNPSAGAGGGECRRYAPRALAVPRMADEGDAVNAVFASVSVEEWCGEWIASSNRRPAMTTPEPVPPERREGCATEAVIFGVVVIGTIAAVATGHLLAAGMLLGAGTFACALGPARRANDALNEMDDSDTHMRQ